MLKIRITRDSVAAGDDYDAPHEKVLSLRDGSTLINVLREVWSVGYLPLIAGGRATWVVEASEPLAVIAQEWPKPRFLSAVLRLPSVPLSIHFAYLAQESPEQVLARLEGQGEPNNSLNSDGPDGPPS